jgi:hypothetical protein
MKGGEAFVVFASRKRRQGLPGSTGEIPNSGYSGYSGYSGT